MPDIQTSKLDSFLCPFSYASLKRRGTRFWGTIFTVFWPLFVAHPLPPTLFETTEFLKTHKHFSDGPCGTICRDETPPVPGQTEQNGDFAVESKRKWSVRPRDGSRFVPRTGPVCQKDGSCLSRTPSRPKCLCLIFFWGGVSRRSA